VGSVRFDLLTAERMSMPQQRDLVVIGASAGGIEALQGLVRELPKDLPATVLIVLHVPAEGGTALPRILSRASAFAFQHAVDGTALGPGAGWVAPGDHHLLVSDGLLLVQRGPRENGHRPAIDPLFRSAARYHGARVIGVVLSGTLDDGAAGLAAVVRMGGTALVQDPEDALYGDMPRHALEQAPAARTGTPGDLGRAIVELVGETVPPSHSPPETLRREVHIVETFDQPDPNPIDHPGEPSQWPCPDCNGVLWQVGDDVLRFRCRVGHAWTAESLARQQDLEVETAMWIALRALEDRAALAQKMAERAAAADRTRSAVRFRDDAHSMMKSAAVLRSMLEQVGVSEASG
jgi:two-component system chemotaxis response regulator CheB